MTNDRILSYINSKDISEYLRSIQYDFSSIEVAWLIYQCHHLTTEDKHKAWQDLISTMPDMSVTSRVWKQPMESLHKFLATYMSIDTQKDITDDERATLVAFDEMWFPFPTPFEKGDILYDVTTKSDDDFCCGPVVIKKIANEYFQEIGRRGFDIGDMWVDGYFQDAKTGSIYKETAYHYMNLEHYPKEKLIGKRRVLIALSSYITEKIDLSLFVNAYHQILTEEYAKDFIPKGFTDEGLSLAGLKIQ